MRKVSLSMRTSSILTPFRSMKRSWKRPVASGCPTTESESSSGAKRFT